METILKMEPSTAAQIVEYNVEQFRGFFTRELFENSPFKGQSIDDFLEAISQKTFEKMEVFLGSYGILRNSRPRYFMYLLMNKVIEVSENVKDEMMKDSRYEYSESPEERDRLRKESLMFISQQFASEIALWNLMNENKYRDALTIISGLEHVYKNYDIYDQLELLNYKMQSSAHLFLYDDFFDALAQLVNLVKDIQVAYSEPDVKACISMFVFDILKKGIPIQFNNSFNLSQQQKEAIGMELQNFLVEKIVIQIFEKRTITSKQSLQQYITNSWGTFENSFKILYPSVVRIVLLKM